MERHGGKDGHEVLAEMKADPEVGGFPVVVLTSRRPGEHPPLLRPARQRLQPKPITLERLVEAVRALD